MSPFKQTALTCAGHTRPVVDLDFSDITDDGYFVISACKDGLPMLRQGDTGDWIGTFEGHKGAVWAATLNRSASIAATGSADYTAKLWDPILGTCITTFEHKHVVKSVKLSGGDGVSLLTGSNEKLLRVFDLQNIDSDPTLYFGHESRIKSLGWLPNDRQFLSISEDKTLRKWNLNTPDACMSIKFDEIPTSMEVQSESGLVLVTHGYNVSFYDFNTLALVKQIKTPTVVNAASYNARDKQFVFGGEDFLVYKYDYETEAELESYKGHFGPVHCMSYSPDYALYATGSEDGTLRLWQNEIGGKYGLWKNANETSVEKVKNGDAETASENDTSESSEPIVQAKAASKEIPKTNGDVRNNKTCTQVAVEQIVVPPADSASLVTPMQNVVI